MPNIAIDAMPDRASFPRAKVPDFEKTYLEFAPQPLKDIATLLIDTGLRIGEALSLRVDDVTLQTDKSASRGSVARLTRLFERAKFGRGELAPGTKDEAIGALETLRAELGA